MEIKTKYRDFVLKREDIEIKVLEMKYLDDFHEYAIQKEVGPSAGWKPHESIRQSKKILKEFINSKLEYGIFLEDTLIGIVGMYEDDYLFEQPEFEEKTGAEIGYSLNKNYWNRGTMTKVAMCFANHSLKDLDYDYVSRSYFVENNIGVRVIEKCGFKFCGKHLYQNFDGTNKLCNYYYIENLKEG